MLTAAWTSRTSATTHSAANNSAIWRITFTVGTSYASCCAKVRTLTSVRSTWEP